MLLLMLAGFAAIFLVKYFYDYFTYWRYIHKIPHSKAVPILGNIFNEVLNAEQIFERNRKHAKEFKDIYSMYGASVGVVNLMKPEDIEQVLTNNVHSTKSNIYQVFQSWLGTGLLTSTGRKWQTRRKMLTPAFHFSILKEFVDTFTREARSLADVLEKKSSEPYVDVVKPITEFAIHSIAETSMGVSFNAHTIDNKTYKDAVYDIGMIFMDRLTKLWLFIPVTYYFTPTRKREKEVLKILHNTTNSVIEERKKIFNGIATKAGDSYSTKKHLAMLDLLLKARQEGNVNIDDEGLREEVDTFMLGGHDTTSAGICYALMVLANHRDIQNKIFEEIQTILGKGNEKMPTFNDLQEMKYLERCIKESLRLFPSVPLIARVCGEGFTTKSGYYIPKGSMINVHIYDVHRRPEIYPNPEKFDPDRFLPENSHNRHPFAFLPFSAGSRNCIGQKYAILEMKAALCEIIRKFILEPVDTPETVKYKADIVLRPSDEIKVKFILRA